jgi:hypothetical protein
VRLEAARPATEPSGRRRVCRRRNPRVGNTLPCCRQLNHPQRTMGRAGRTPLARPSVTLAGTSSASQVKTAASTKAHASGGRPKLVLAAPLDDDDQRSPALAGNIGAGRA